MHSHRVALVVVLLLLAWASDSQSPAPNVLALDNTIINTTYFDLHLAFTNIEDFQGGLQTEWRFLRRLCGLEPIYRDFYRQYSLNRYPAPVGSVGVQRCSVGTTGSLAMPTVNIKLSAQGLPVIPYKSDVPYILSLVFSGTEQAAYNFTVALMQEEREAMLILGVTDVLTLPWQQGDLYSGGRIYLTTDVRATLSVAWHVIIVSFFALLVGIVITFALRTNRSLSAEEEAAKDPDVEDLDQEDREALARAAERWEEPDIEMQRKNLLTEANELEPDRIKEMSSAFARPLLQDGIAETGYAESSSPMRRVNTTIVGNDFEDPLEATVRSSRSPSIVATAVSTRKKPNKKEYNPSHFVEALTYEPAFNMPPESSVIKTQKSIKERIREKKEKEEEEKKIRAAKEREALLEGMGTDLPPDAEMMEIIRKREAEKKRKEQLPPMGLASRRMAAMMSTLAITPNPSAVATGSTGVMMGGMTSSNVRRTVAALPTREIANELDPDLASSKRARESANSSRIDVDEILGVGGGSPNTTVVTAPVEIPSAKKQGDDTPPKTALSQGATAGVRPKSMSPSSKEPPSKLPVSPSSRVSPAPAGASKTVPPPKTPGGKSPARPQPFGNKAPGPGAASKSPRPPPPGKLPAPKPVETFDDL